MRAGHAIDGYAISPACQGLPREFLPPRATTHLQSTIDDGQTDLEFLAVHKQGEEIAGEHEVLHERAEWVPRAAIHETHELGFRIRRQPHRLARVAVGEIPRVGGCRKLRHAGRRALSIRHDALNAGRYAWCTLLQSSL